MELAGIDSSTIARKQRRAREAETFVAQQIEGILTPRYDSRGDVLLLDGEVVDVKTVPFGFRFVNAGSRRPRHAIVVVEDSDRAFRLAGIIGLDAWSWGGPPVRNAQPCWWTSRDSVRPIYDPPPARGTDEEQPSIDESNETRASRMELGVDDPPELDPQDEQRAKWRLYQQRHRDRERAALGLVLFDDDYPGRGLGGPGGRPPARR